MTAPELVGALAALAASRDSKGGWGWRRGAPGNTECTSLATLALGAWQATHPGFHDAVHDGLSWLHARQHRDGSWPLSDAVPGSSWTTSVACCALAQAGADSREHAVSGGRWLLDSRSRGPNLWQQLRMRFSSEPPLVDQDPRIPGWGWAEETSAWVEPTAWALLALKQLRWALPKREVAERIDQGHALLADRMCRGGGWNYGNKAVMGADLPPYPDTTALALLALQDHRARGVTEASIERLGELLEENRSAMAMALSILALQQHGRDVRYDRAELMQRLPSLADRLEARTLALVLLALHESRTGLRVPRDA